MAIGCRSNFFLFLVRSAYLRLSKDFHPDLNVGKDEQDTETIHNKGRSWKIKLV
jgi:hypothetical protein